MSRSIEAVFDQAVNNFNYRSGIRQIEKILAQHPEWENDQTLSWLGLLYDHQALRSDGLSRRQLEEKAFRLYRRALRFNPQSPSALWGIGRIWWHRKSKKAIKYATQAARNAYKQNGSFTKFFNLAVVYETLGNPKRAEYWYRKVIEKEPSYWAAYYSLINLYVSGSFANKQKKIEKLIPAFEKNYKSASKEIRASKWGQMIQDRIEQISRDQKTERVI